LTGTTPSAASYRTAGGLPGRLFDGSDLLRQQVPKGARDVLPCCLRFYELVAAGPAPIANETLRRIAELYRIEES